MNFSLYGYDSDNNTIDFMNYIKKINGSQPVVRFPDDYWFFEIFMTIVTPVIYGIIVVIGLIANMMVILGKYR